MKLVVEVKERELHATLDGAPLLEWKGEGKEYLYSEKVVVHYRLSYEAANKLHATYPLLDSKEIIKTFGYVTAGFKWGWTGRIYAVKDAQEKVIRWFKEGLSKTAKAHEEIARREGKTELYLHIAPLGSAPSAPPGLRARKVVKPRRESP